MIQTNLFSEMLTTPGTSNVIAPDHSRARRGQPPQGKARLSDQARAVAESLQASTISPSVISGSVRIVDGLIVGAVALVALFWAVKIGYWHPVLPLGMAVTTVLAAILFQAADCYQTPIMRTRLSQAARVIIGWSLTCAVYLSVEALLKIGTPPPLHWFAIWYGLTLAALLGWRMTLSTLVRQWTRQGRLEHRAIIVGGGESAAEFIREIEAQPDHAVRICGIFDDRSHERSPPLVAGYPKLGTVADLVEFARIAHVDMLISTIPLRAEQRLLELMKQLWVLPVDIRLSAHSERLEFRDRASYFIGAVPLLGVADKPVADWDAIAKRTFDLFFATLALVLLSPLMLITALAIRLDSNGPVLFRQKRYGFNNEVIDVLKFRSMYHEMADPFARRVVTRGDSRITRVGRIIRKTSIDELPQLINVLKGELSLVGPRPHAVNAHTNDRLWEEVVDGYFARHKVKPGVTGWAQIKGWRGEVDTPEKIQKRVEHDVYYIEHWSILFDLYILFMTPIALFNTENAY